MIVDSSISGTIQKWDKSNSNEHSILQMISELLIYSVIKLKLDAELMKLQILQLSKRNAEEEVISIPS